MRNIVKAALFAVTASVATLVFAKATAPEETAGLDAELYYNHALGSQIAPMEGYALRGRKIIVEPGGGTAEHSHADRPGIVYVLEGTLDEHRGDVKRVVVPGDTWVEDADTVHWIQNTSDKPAAILAFDLVQDE